MLIIVHKQVGFSRLKCFCACTHIWKHTHTHAHKSHCAHPPAPSFHWLASNFSSKAEFCQNVFSDNFNVQKLYFLWDVFFMLHRPILGEGVRLPFAQKKGKGAEGGAGKLYSLCTNIYIFCTILSNFWFYLD